LRSGGALGRGHQFRIETSSVGCTQTAHKNPAPIHSAISAGFGSFSISTFTS